jgi:hypothetical protein
LYEKGNETFVTFILSQAMKTVSENRRLEEKISTYNKSKRAETETLWLPKNMLISLD